MPADAVRSLSATNDVEPEKRLPHPSVVSSSVTIPVTSTVSLAPRRSSSSSRALLRLSLITSILSAGTFFGAIIAGDVADIIGRKWTIIAGCLIYIVGVVLQVATNGLGLIVAGRLVAGLGVGFESAIVILYMSEICPKKVRGALVAGYQFCITIGLLLAACVNYGVKDYQNSAEYRVPIGLQFIFGLVLGVGLF